MIDKFLISILVFVCTFSSMGIKAQNKPLSLDDLIPGGRTYSRFTPRALKQLQWYGNQYIHAKGDSILCGLPSGNKQDTVLCTLETINRALSNAELDPAKSMPAFSVPYDDKPVLSFTLKGKKLFYHTESNEIIAQYPLQPHWKRQDFNPKNNCIAFTDENNLGILFPDGTVGMLTSDTDKNIVNGQSVHRREFGIHKGTFWSPAGNKLAFYRMDERMVTDYPLVNADARCAELNAIKYPMAGMKSHEVTVGVYDLETKKTIFLQTGAPEEKYLTNIAWSPDGKSIYIAEVNREQNECVLNRYNAGTGKKETSLFTESHPKYVEPQNPVLFLKNDPDKFIWQSMRDGYNHLYLYDTRGNLLKQLTRGEWVITDVIGFDTKGNTLLYLSTEISPLERHLYALNLKNGKTNRLTAEEGMHSVRLSPSGAYLIDTYSSQDNPQKTDITTVKGIKTRNLQTASDPFRNHRFPTIQVGTIKAADDKTDLYYRMITPPDMDSTKKHPAIVYVYGGPHAQLITNSWLAGTKGWDIYMALKGYVVFTVDGRGSDNRGAAFENVIHRNLGVHEMADQLEGIEFLKSRPFVDGEKIGVHGWSYGGFMTTNLMLSYPDIFKVGVAGGPVIDWNYYEVMYGERYMDSPKDNPEGYKQADLKAKAGNLKGHLLLIHGDIDPVVVWQHSLSFLKACVNARTYPDYFVYPRHEHNVIGKDRVHLHEKITRYFDDYLK